MSHYRRLLLTASILSCISLPVLGADVDVTDTTVTPTLSKQSSKHDAVDLKRVVVTASGYEQTIKNAPASISVVTAEDISKRGYTDFAGILKDVEGVDVSTNPGRGGSATVSIRGMGSDYTLIMVDGVPQNGSSSSDLNQNSFGGQMQSFIPPVSSIERVEVVRGPMSTLYGSDAMGGVINIITKKVTKKWTGNITYDHTFETDKGRKDTNRYSLSVRGPLVQDKLGMELRGSYIFRPNSTFADGSVIRGNNLTPPELKNYTVGAKFNWTPTKKHAYSLDLDSAISDMSGGDTVDNAGVRYDRQKVTFKADNRINIGKVETTLAYNTTKLNYFSSRKLEDQNIIFEPRLLMSKWKNHMSTFGIRYWHENLKDTQLNTILGKNKVQGDTFAIYAEDTWSINKKLDFTYGLRYEHPDKYDDHFTPRGYLVYKANDNWTIKGGVAGGYKVPTLMQTQNGIVRISGGRGFADIDIYGNPNLKPERSLNKELGVYFSDKHGVHANVTYFNTDYKDKIDTVEDWAPVRRGRTTIRRGRQHYINTDRARLHGLETSVTLPINDKLRFKTNYTLILSKITSGLGKGDQLSGTPRHAINARFDYDVNEKLNLWLAWEYKNRAARYFGGSTPTAGLGKYYAPTSIFSMGAGYKFTNNFKMNVAINNLLNKNFDETILDATGTPQYKYFSAGRPGTTGTYTPGRNYWVSFSYDF